MPSLRPRIDGEDLLAGYSNSQGRDPDHLLPPSSSVLLPTVVGRRALIGCCSCGETGCGALAIRVHRHGRTVKWSPIDSPGPETLRRTYRFGLEQYMDAIDHASRDRPGEGRGRAAARMVRAALADHVDRYGDWFGGRVDWVWCRHWGSDEIRAAVSSPTGQEISEYAPEASESDEQFADRVVRDLYRQRMRGLNPSGRPTEERSGVEREPDGEAES